MKSSRNLCALRVDCVIQYECSHSEDSFISLFDCNKYRHWLRVFECGRRRSRFYHYYYCRWARLARKQATKRLNIKCYVLVLSPSLG